jgi:hypothetical protein
VGNRNGAITHSLNQRSFKYQLGDMITTCKKDFNEKTQNLSNFKKQFISRYVRIFEWTRSLMIVINVGKLTSKIKF